MIVTSKNLGLFDNIVAAVGRPDQVELGVVTGVEKKEEKGEIESVAHLKRLTPTNGQIGNFLSFFPPLPRRLRIPHWRFVSNDSCFPVS